MALLAVLVILLMDDYVVVVMVLRNFGSLCGEVIGLVVVVAGHQAANCHRRRWQRRLIQVLMAMERQMADLLVLTVGSLQQEILLGNNHRGASLVLGSVTIAYRSMAVVVVLSVILGMRLTGHLGGAVVMYSYRAIYSPLYRLPPLYTAADA